MSSTTWDLWSLFSRSTNSPEMEEIMYINSVYISPPPQKKKTKKKTCCASFGRFITTSYGTELIPLFPYLRAGLLKKKGGGGGGGGTLVEPDDRFLITDYGLKGSSPQGQPRPGRKFVSSVYEFI